MNFTSILTVDGFDYHLAFRKIETPGLLKFFVTAKSPFIEPFSFEIKNEEGKWKVLPPAPDWLTGCEHRLSEIIRLQTAL